jgi:hypothetical protein
MRMPTDTEGGIVMDLEKRYKTIKGVYCNILQLVKSEPAWAANIIQEYEKQTATSVPFVEVKGNMNRCGTCPHKAYLLPCTRTKQTCQLIPKGE